MRVFGGRDHFWLQGIMFGIPIGLALVFLCGSMIHDHIRKDRVHGANLQMQAIAREIAKFQDDCGSHPLTLDALIERPAKCRGASSLKQSAFIDPWGQTIRYTVLGSHYELISLGEDQKLGGEGFSADIVFTEGE